MFLMEVDRPKYQIPIKKRQQDYTSKKIEQAKTNPLGFYDGMDLKTFKERAKMAVGVTSGVDKS
jgi:hypothetical protein